jgi:outer membrane protein OmpA-like peptidoglycan-associated protein
MELSINTADFHGPDFGLGPLTTDFAQFWLLDPVGRKLYFTLREQDGKKAFGTRKNSTTDSFRKGTRYPVEVYFPPLPAGVKQVTVLAMAGLGELTGIPVTDGAPPPVAKPGEEGQAETGGVFQWPVTPPTADAWSYVADVQEYVETPERSVTQQGEDETVALRTDVLFAFDQATLSPKAASILRDVAQETRERADPARPPIEIEGHTDSKGEDAYNQRLSERRAKAVRDYLARILGVDYTYRATGKGEHEPIAKNERPDGGDNPEGRARNRRVEISYKVKNRTPDMTVTLSPSATTGATVAAGPAPFRGDDLGPVVGSLTRGELRLDMHPLYRDGALLVAPFEIEHEQGDVRRARAPAVQRGVRARVRGDVAVQRDHARGRGHQGAVLRHADERVALPAERGHDDSHRLHAARLHLLPRAAGGRHVDDLRREGSRDGQKRAHLALGAS